VRCYVLRYTKVRCSVQMRGEQECASRDSVSSSLRFGAIGESCSRHTDCWVSVVNNSERQLSSWYNVIYVNIICYSRISISNYQS